MKSYLVDVSLDGSREHVVTGKRCSIPEIAILRHLHGATSVANVRAPEEVDDYSEDEERNRLVSIYEPVQREELSIMDRLFGATGRLPATLRDIGIDAKAAAKEAEAEAAAATERAKALRKEAESEAKGAKAAEAAEAEAFS